MTEDTETGHAVLPETGRRQGGSLHPGQGYGQMTVQQCCEVANIPLTQGLTRLKDVGIKAAAHEQLKTIANRSGRKAIDLIKIINSQ